MKTQNMKLFKALLFQQARVGIKDSGKFLLAMLR